jgi:hypothetical protein
MVAVDDAVALIRSFVVVMRSSRMARRGVNSSRTAAIVVCIPSRRLCIPSRRLLILSNFLSKMAARDESLVNFWLKVAACASNAAWIRVAVGLSAR